MSTTGTDPNLSDGPLPKEQDNYGESMQASALLSNNLPADDPNNPQNWSLYDKVITSSQAWFYSFAVALGITCFTTGLVGFETEFKIKVLPEEVIAAFSLELFGIAFAPIFTPHVTERIGRSIFYAICITLQSIMHLGTGYVTNVTGVQVCRFFAGFFGGPILILVEGTFADMWSPEYTITWYAILSSSQFIGAGFGPLFGAYLVSATRDNWRWTEWFPAILGGVALAYGFTMRESYQREIPRRLQRITGKSRSQVIAEQGPAPTGATFMEIVKIAVVDPLMMFLTNPIVFMVTYILFFTWALTFQWFYSVLAAFTPKPPAGAGFTLDEVGYTLLVAVVGAVIGAVFVILTNMLTIPIIRRKIARDPAAAYGAVEWRVLPAIPGAIFMIAGIFWAANTISAEFQPVVPITGAGVFIVGATMTTYVMIPYLYDTFTPTGVISALTTQAVGRVLAAGFLPLVILVSITNLKGPVWGLGLFGFFGIPCFFFPIIIFMFGTEMRRKSKWSM